MQEEEFEWHDGVLRQVLIQPDLSVELHCDLYPSFEVGTRNTYTFVLTGLSSLVCTLDFKALEVNRRAGNISDGRLETSKGKGVVLKLFVADGYLQIGARKLEINPGSTPVQA